FAGAADHLLTCSPQHPLSDVPRVVRSCFDVSICPTEDCVPEDDASLFTRKVIGSLSPAPLPWPETSKGSRCCCALTPRGAAWGLPGGGRLAVRDAIGAGGGGQPGTDANRSPRLLGGRGRGPRPGCAPACSIAPLVAALCTSAKVPSANRHSLTRRKS